MNKTKNYTTIIFMMVIGILISGCGSSEQSCGSEKLIYVDSFSSDSENNLYIEYKQNYKSKSNFAQLNLDKEHTWNYLEKNPNLLNQDIISYDRNRVQVTHDDEVVFEDTLPLKEEIGEALNMDLSSADINYTAFRVGENFTWDMRTHIASIGVSKEPCSLDIACYSKVLYVSIVKSNNNWNIFLINTIDNGSVYSFISTDIEHRLSTDDKANFCLDYDVKYITASNSKCFVKDDDKIVLKKLFGEIYPKEYMSMIDGIRLRMIAPSNLPSIIFDDEDNMHLFYNDYDNRTGKYFYYKMFSKDEPTVPKYEQKIEWQE